MWGMALLSTCVAFVAPLVYIKNKQVIDSQLEHAGNVIGAQASQVKDLTAHHAGKSLETVKAYTGDYAAKAQEMVGRQKTQGDRKPSVKEGDFPIAPKSEPIPPEPFKSGVQPVPAS